jgi:hypothetical protein
MKRSVIEGRIISWPNLDARINEGNSFKLLLQETHLAWILFNSGTKELSLEIKVSSDAMPSVLPQAINFRIKQTEENNKLLVLTSADADLYRYFYDFVVEVLELISLNNIEASVAIDEAWKRWGQLIEQQSILSRDKQVGLLGELWLLRRLAHSKHWEYAIDAWHRSPQAEHDFCLENVDIEVKSTATDRRIHTIGSINQLQPSPGRELYILSLQFAPSPSHASGAFSLTSYIDNILEELNDHNSRGAFVERLKRVGWHSDHMAYYKTSFIKREDAYLVAVNNKCPRIIQSMIEKSIGTLSARIQSVMYSIDLSGLGCADGTPEFMSLIP